MKIYILLKWRRPDLNAILTGTFSEFLVILNKFYWKLFKKPHFFLQNYGHSSEILDILCILTIVFDIHTQMVLLIFFYFFNNFIY